MIERELNSYPLVYNEIFDVSPQGICIISKEGVYLDVNQNFAELLGYSSKNDLIGKSIEEVTHPDDFEMDRMMTEKIFSGDINTFELDKRFLKKNGDVTWLKLHASTFQGTLGIGILEPIKERSELEGKIAKLKKDLDQFIYRVSHDIRSPVANILGLTAINYDNKEEVSNLLSMARESALKLDHIIREIANYSQNREFLVKTTVVNLASEIDQICEEILTEKKPGKINIHKKVGYKNGVKTDHSRLHIILKNLLANALSFSRENGNIHVSADVKDAELILSVKDDGIGIRQDIQAKIYDMFYRGSNLSQGAGLGLFIVKDVLKEINGEISFTSSEGEGTEFQVRIPIERGG